MTAIIGSFRLGGAGSRPWENKEVSCINFRINVCSPHSKANCAVKSSSSGRGEGEKGAMKYFSQRHFFCRSWPPGEGWMLLLSGCGGSSHLHGVSCGFLSQTCLCSTHRRAIQGMGNSVHRHTSLGNCLGEPEKSDS